MTTLYLCGAGNSEGVRLAAAVNRRRNRWDRIAVLDDDPQKHGRQLLDVAVEGPIGLLATVDPASAEAVNLVARTTATRAVVRERIRGLGVPFATLVHPDVDTEWAALSPGVLVYEQGIVSPETFVGEDSVVFMRAVVGHETRIGAGCVLAPGAVLNARVVLEDGVYVGSNASIVPEVRVGAGAVIGANTLVIADVPAGATVVGVPGQVVSRGEAPPADRAGDDATATAESAPGATDPELERRIAAIWREVLGRPVEQVTVNFCHLGGTSLLALRVLDRVRAQLGFDLPATAFFQYPTVRSFAEHLLHRDDDATSLRAHQRAALRRSRAQR